MAAMASARNTRGSLSPRSILTTVCRLTPSRRDSPSWERPARSRYSRTVDSKVGMPPRYPDGRRYVKITIPSIVYDKGTLVPGRGLSSDLSPRSTWGHVQNTGSSVYKPPRTGPERRLPRSQLGPGSEPCNNPTGVVARRVARLLRSGVLGAIEGAEVSLSVPDGADLSPGVGPEAVQVGSVVRSAYLTLLRTHPVVRAVEFRRRVAPSRSVDRIPSAPWQRRDGLSGSGAGAPPCCHHRSPGLGRPRRACRPSRRAGRPAATR